MSCAEKPINSSHPCKRASYTTIKMASNVVSLYAKMCGTAAK
jgi:hypothetical protein